MKSYLLVTGDFVKTGGMDRANFALADYLKKKEEKVHLVAHRVADDLLTDPHVKFHPVPKLANSYLLSGPLLNWMGCWQARRFLKENTRVLVNGGNCQWGDVNWVHYVHAAYQPDYQVGLLRQLKGKVSHRMFLDAEKRALTSARVIIVNSRRTKQDLMEKLAIPEEKLHVVYYGIDSHVFYPATPAERAILRQQLGWSPDKNIVIFIGALGDRRKGFDTVFTAWQQLCKSSDWNAELVVVGVGAELTEWQNRAAIAGITNIRFLGFRNDVANLLRAADCLVAPTRYEAYGLGVHEALCCGLPAIVSADAGVAERYPQQLQDLLLPNPEDAVDLVARLQKWRTACSSASRSHQEDYSKLVLSLSQELRGYTWDDMADSILQISS
jgi:glycosyltransferase involved in cell wall biosynthesis